MIVYQVYGSYPNSFDEDEMAMFCSREEAERAIDAIREFSRSYDPFHKRPTFRELEKAGLGMFYVDDMFYWNYGVNEIEVHAFQKNLNKKNKES